MTIMQNKKVHTVIGYLVLKKIRKAPHTLSLLTRNCGAEFSDGLGTSQFSLHCDKELGVAKKFDFVSVVKFESVPDGVKFHGVNSQAIL